MSLKAFHKFFITVAILFCGWLAESEFKQYTRQGTKESLYTAIATGLTAGGLILYLIRFFRKSKGQSAI